MLHPTHLIAPLSLALAAAAGAPAATIHVPADAPTIAAAVAMALDGDIVELAPGTYTGDGNRDVVVDGPMITIRGAAGSLRTIIDCQGSEAEPHRAFAVTSPGLVLEGLTIQNGWVLGYGGGVWITSLDGGGTYSMTDCAFVACTTNVVDPEAGGGGALAVVAASELVVGNCRFTDNHAIDFTGGIAFDCGGLLAHWVGNVTLEDCAFTGNTASWIGALAIGGGIHVHVRRCELAHNVSNHIGAAIIGADSSVVVQSCLFHHNMAPVLPAAYIGGSCDFLHSTVVDNTSTDPDLFIGSIQFYGGYLRASVFWEDAVAFGHALPLSCCIKGDSSWTEYNCTSADPLFVDPANGDYRLQSNSPLIDYGGTDPVLAGEFDLDGNPRQVDIPWAPNGVGSVADLGCFEFQPPAAPSADLDGNGVVDAADLGILLGAWGGAAGDLNLDGTTDAADLGLILGAWTG